VEMPYKGILAKGKSFIKGTPCEGKSLVKRDPLQGEEIPYKGRKSIILKSIV